MKEFITSILLLIFSSPFNIAGDSMEPTFSDRDVIMTESVSYIDEEPQRFDIIVFYGTDEPDKFFVKRIIGMPEETIVMREDDIYIIDEDGNEEELLQPFRHNPATVNNLRQMDGTTYEIPYGKYFVLGDNRDSSYDSRTWKDPFVPKENIVGKYYFTLN